ncbi:hypothetical protein Hanom_Chr06g00539711 [Helianthus anomalus]
MSLTLNKLGGSLWRKRVKRIKNEKKSVVWMQGILYSNGRRSSSKKNRTHEKEASAHCFVINF